ncbi:unnamed protein product, partial [Amoebophrya sp. A25]
MDKNPRFVYEGPDAKQYRNGGKYFVMKDAVAAMLKHNSAVAEKWIKDNDFGNHQEVLDARDI